MNERIKQLKKQATDFYLLDETLDCSITELHQLVEQKFAELIVKECTDIVLTTEVSANDNALLRGTIFEKMKQLFGVEEPTPLKLGPGVNYRPTYPDQE